MIEHSEYKYLHSVIAPFNSDSFQMQRSKHNFKVSIFLGANL